MLNIPENVNNILNKFIRQVQEVLGNHVKKIILYGSYARGDYNEHSDLDIMILTDYTDRELIEYRDKISDIAFDIEFDDGFFITISPLLKNIDKFNQRVEVIPFYMNVQKEGVLLNG